MFHVYNFICLSKESLIVVFWYPFKPFWFSLDWLYWIWNNFFADQENRRVCTYEVNRYLFTGLIYIFDYFLNKTWYKLLKKNISCQSQQPKRWGCCRTISPGPTSSEAEDLFQQAHTHTTRVCIYVDTQLATQIRQILRAPKWT